MKSVIFYLSFLLALFFGSLVRLAGQSTPKWINYTAGVLIGSFDFEGDYVWVPTQGGLLKMNRTDGTKEIFLPTNSSLQGIDVDEVLVDTGGVKWIGARRGGLMRFDGSHWQRFDTIPTGDTLIQIANLCRDAVGRIWFLSRINNNVNGHDKLFCYDGKQFTRMPSFSTWGYKKIVPDVHGKVWTYVGSTVIYADGTDSIVRYDRSALGLLANESIQGIGYDKFRDVFYVSTLGFNAQYRLLAFINGQWVVVDPGGSMPGAIRVMTNDPQGRLWLYYSGNTSNTNTNGLKIYDGNNWASNSLKDWGIGSEVIYGLKFDQKGHLWAHFKEPNADIELHERLENGRWQDHDTHIYPIETNYWYDVAFDKLGRAWIGGMDNVVVFDGIHWVTYDAFDLGLDSIPSNPSGFFRTSSMAVDTSSGDVLIAFNDGPVCLSKFDGRQFHPYKVAGLSGATKILPTGDGKYWLSSIRSLGYFNGHTWTIYNSTNSPLSSTYYGMIELDQQGNLWVYDFYGKMHRFDGHNWESIDQTNVELGFIYCDKKGTVWVSGKGGPMFFNGVGWTLNPIPGFPPNRIVNAMAQDIDSTYWIDGDGSIYHWDGKNQWTRYDVENAPLAHGFTYSIKVDPFGNKWFIQGRGITVYNEKGIHNQWVNPAKTVSGRVFFDTNRDGKYNAHIEPGIAKEKILILPDSTILFSNVYGKYYLVPTSNTKEVTYAPSSNFQLTSVPAAYTFGTTMSQGLDFGVWSPSIPQNIELVSTNSILRCNAPISIYVQAFNKGFKAESGVLTFHYDPRVSFMSAEPMPTAVGDNTLYWNFEDLSYLETFSVKVVLDSLTINNIGDTLYFSSTLQTGEGADAYRAEYSHSEAVRCSYDPNDKISRPTGVFSDNLSLKKDALDFTIRFENTGNDTAFVVVVRDTLSAFLDITTFEVLASSHPVQTHLSPKGVVTFVFKDIHLLWQQKDDLASQGFVTYRIRARSDLADGVTIKNRAHIYFDLNPGIATNTTFNQLVETLPTLDTKTIDLQHPWHLGPNPTNGSVWVDLPEGATKLRFFDLLQQHTSHIEFPNRSGYLHDLRPGIYIVCPDGFTGICKKLVVIKD